MASTTLNLSAVKEEKCADSSLACRICLASDVKLFNIREWGLELVFEELMGTSLSAWDGFPQHLCAFCRALLLRGRELRARCRRAEHLLKQALMHQHFITTNFIRSIDRNLHKLTHTFTHNRNNGEEIFLKHDNTQIDIKTDPNNIFIIENNIDNDVKDFDRKEINDDDDDNGTNFDAATETVHIELEDVSVPQNTPQINIVESCDQTIEKIEIVKIPHIVKECDETVKKDIKSCKRKIVKKKKERTPEKKGRAWRLKPFCEEEGFKEFEEKYNFKIVSRSEEDMVKEMEDRKKSDNYVRSVFKCELCFKGFLSQSTFGNHMKIHDEARRHGCRLCQQRFFAPAKLRAHMRDQHQLKFSCRKCDDPINSKASAVLHAAFHAGATFKCDHCDQQFLKMTTRSSHMRLAHPGAAGGACALCGETFISAAGLKVHKTRSHGPALPGLRCRTCKLRFESAAAIARHRRDQPGGKCDDKHCSCPRCGEACASEQDLLAHRVEQHGLQLFTCDACDKSFESPASLATHVDRVHRLLRAPPPARPAPRRPPAPRAAPRPAARREPVCEHCGKRATCMATLKIHMNKHTGERPYKCDLCPKTFMTPHGLTAHQPSHTGARPWRCAQCGASFMRQSSLSQHRRSIHSGVRAYQCHICAKTFTQSGSLQTHIKYVHMKVKPPPRKRSKKPAT